MGSFLQKKGKQNRLELAKISVVPYVLNWKHSMFTDHNNFDLDGADWFRLYRHDFQASRHVLRIEN